MKRILLFLFLTLFFVYPKKIFANENFSVSLDNTYTVSENGLTHIAIQGEIVNKSNMLFPSMFSFNVGFTDIKNLYAKDKLGDLIITEKKGNDSTSVLINFNHRASGVGSKEDFSVSFDTNQVAKKNGQIWEISIPGIMNQEEFDQFNIHVSVPKSFGNPAYIKPYQIGNNLDFDKNTIGSAGISMAFGKLQSYDFSLHYQLKNTGVFPIKTQIALPPGTNYQTVVLESLNPSPMNIFLDNDGNWIAQYNLNPSEEKDVIAKGTILLSLNPNPESLSESQKELYLREQPFWQKNDSDVKKLADDLKTPREIYDYVVSHLRYDYSRVAGNQERLGAQKILQDPSSAVCLEFSDLFVTLARATGIPAREVDGFAYTNNSKLKPVSLVKDVLHTWPEYYDFDKKTWIMVDPTWENTTHGIDYFSVFDFDHIAFSINGESSTSPLPAGSYKLSSDSRKDVSVTFSKITNIPNSQISLLIDFPSKTIAGIPLSGFLVIKNIGVTLVPAEKIQIDSSLLNPLKNTIDLSSVPPFGIQKIPVTFSGNSFLTKGKETITIHVAGNTLSKQISVVPFFFGKEYFYEGVAVAILGLIIFIIAAKAGRLPFFRKRG